MTYVEPQSSPPNTYERFFAFRRPTMRFCSHSSYPATATLSVAARHPTDTLAVVEPLTITAGDVGDVPSGHALVAIIVVAGADRLPVASTASTASV